MRKIEQGAEHSYTQPNLQLYQQLLRDGYSNEDLASIFSAYELARHLFTCLYRASRKTFISHLIGTASILASLRVSVNVVAAGMIHAAYFRGDFGDGKEEISDAKRTQVRKVVGQEAEEYVARYATLPWTRKTILAMRSSIATLGPIDRGVLLIHLANELEEHLDLGVLYCPGAKKRKERIQKIGPMLVDLAEMMGFPSLAAELARVFSETLNAEVLPELRSQSASDGAFLVIPFSYRRRLSVQSRQKLAAAKHRLRRPVGIARKRLLAKWK